MDTRWQGRLRRVRVEQREARARAAEGDGYRERLNGARRRRPSTKTPEWSNDVILSFPWGLSLSLGSLPPCPNRLSATPAWGRRSTPATLNTHARNFTDRERRGAAWHDPPRARASPFFFFSYVEIRVEDSCPSRGQIQNALHSHNRDLLIRQPPRKSQPPQARCRNAS